MPKDTKPRPAPHPRPSSVISLLTGWVQQGVESFFATQRVLVDVAMRQNAVAMKTLREGLSDPENSPLAIMAELAVEGTSSFVEAQRILLNMARGARRADPRRAVREGLCAAPGQGPRRADRQAARGVARAIAGPTGPGQRPPR